MKLAVTLNDETTLEQLLETEVDTIIIGYENLSHRMKVTYDIETIKGLVNKVKSHQKSVWINMNIIMHDDHIEAAQDALSDLKELDIDGILFADLAVYVLSESFGLTNKLIYYPETYTTSRIDAEFWKHEKIQSIVLARELTLKDVLEISIDAPLPITLVGHGYLNMFHSRRPLVENFFKYTEEENPDSIKNSKKLTIVEEQRDESYKIVQDAFGTHIFRAKPLASFSVLEQIKPHIDTLIIDTLFLEQHTFDLINDYYVALNSKSYEAIIEKYKETHDDGFYFKKTILNKKGEIL
ncbi:MAG: peptidase U32 family protein [Candidatus Izemoplasmataceae bacterium]|jgi:U32 family peptidase|uniref:peptidase U32 family protein n=1 Tax=Liberiplasma polymorphum TaxID=3374570 RepID=UPI00377325E6